MHRNLFAVRRDCVPMCRCTLILEYESEAVARTVLEAVKVDNGDFMEAHLDGRKLIASCRAASPLALRHTLDDFLTLLDNYIQVRIASILIMVEEPQLPDMGLQCQVQGIRVSGMAPGSG